MAMLGCVTGRSKPSVVVSNTVAPQDVKFVGRTADSITLDFALQAVGPAPFALESVACYLQHLEQGTFGSDWASLADTRWHKRRTPPGATSAASTEDFIGGEAAGGGASSSSFSRLECCAVVPRLAAETDYIVRVLARGGPKEPPMASAPVKCRTSDRPTCEAIALLCVGRQAHLLELEWEPEDPEGAPILECEVHYRLDSLLSSWATVSMACLEAPTGAWPSCRRWRGVVDHLEGNTAYRIRARARNSVGWSLDCSPEKLCWTSDRPAAPEGLLWLARRPTSATLAFEVKDPDGAPVHTYAAQLHGVLGYSAHTECRFVSLPPRVGADGRYPAAVRQALCIVEGLQPETEYWVRLWTTNDSGTSRQPSHALEVSTSRRPRAPEVLSVQVGPQALAVEWEVKDPAGAPVTACELEYCRDSLFGSWEAVAAAPVAVTAPGLPRTGAAQMVAAVVVAELTGGARLTRRWRVQLDGLDRETAYLLRARARNVVGWSSGFSPTASARTSDRPPAPHSLRCVERHPTGVFLELRVAEVLGTAPVQAICVERSGSLSWQERHEIEIVKVDRSVPGESRWVFCVPLGMSPGTVHELRVWASNAFGRSSKPSATCVCATSDKPKPPATIECAARYPHALCLEWVVPDPEGAPVWRFEVQCRKDGVLASWQPAAALDTSRVEPGPEPGRWRSIVEQLDSGATYRLCVRAQSEVGWSEWSGEVAFETSGPPLPVAVVPRLFPCTSASLGELQNGEPQASNTPGCSRALLLDLYIEDPEGAPVLACMVRCRDKGQWTLARKVLPSPAGAADAAPSPEAGRRGGAVGGEVAGRWCAVVAVPQATCPPVGQTLPLNVRAASSVGWTRSQELRALLVAEGQQQVGAGTATRSTLDLVSAEVRAALAAQGASQERLRALLREATGREEQEHAGALAAHVLEVEQRISALQEVAQQMEPTGPSGDVGAALAKHLQDALLRPKLAPTAAVGATVLSLLLRGYIWLERSWRADLRSMSEGIAKARDSIPSAGGSVLMQWVAQHQAWSERFERRVEEALPEGLARAAQLIATLASGRKLELLEASRGDLEACLALVSTAERQLRRLRNSHRILCAAEASSCHDFEQKGVLKKIETTALGLVTVLVLPVPGSIEVGTVGIGMLWLDGDASNSHVAVEHPTGVPLGPVLQRLGSSPPPRATVIIAGWASGGHRGVVLVHNATARRITVNVLPGEKDSFATKAVAKLSEAHPYVRMTTAAMAQKEGGDSMVSISPTDVALIQVPDGWMASGSSADADGAQQKTVRLEFSYGSVSAPEKAVGRATVCPGSAVSFVCLDTTLLVSNSDGESNAVEEGAIRVVNNDLSQVIVALNRAPEAQKRFEGAFLTETLLPGDSRLLPLPQPCIGRIFQVEVNRDGRQKEVAEVRSGQCLTVEGCG